MLTGLIEYETPKVVTVHNLSIGETSAFIMRLQIRDNTYFSTYKGRMDLIVSIIWGVGEGVDDNNNYMTKLMSSTIRFTTAMSATVCSSVRWFVSALVCTGISRVQHCGVQHHNKGQEPRDHLSLVMRHKT